MIEHTRKGRLVVLVGPSAVGKSTVVRCVRERLPDLVFSVSATTRAPRPGEVDGVDYHFVSRAEFDAMIEAGELLEWADIHGGLQRSGTPAGPVRAALAEGLPVLVEVDLEGARSVRRAIPEGILVFLAPPSWEELVARLTSRGTESPEVIERRLETARIELAACDEFDIVIVNDEVTSACEQLVSLFVSTNSSS
ncbi:guanylate kinase [Nocardia sp. NPDC057455]|uniref:guanylate kinase n=1 Tax=Nocardia sp. NPDC057455 TaxID=3346138 RepID=UPI003672E4AE